MQPIVLCLCAIGLNVDWKHKSLQFTNVPFCMVADCESRPVAYMCQVNVLRLRPHSLTRTVPAPVSSVFGHCVTVTFDMRSPSDRKTGPKALSGDNCVSSQQSLAFFYLYLFTLCLHRACSKEREAHIRACIIVLHSTGPLYSFILMKRSV